VTVRSGQLVAGQFVTLDGTGALVAADGLPVGTLVVNGVDNGAQVTITTPSVGVYKWAVTLPVLSVGDIVQTRMAATITGIQTGGVVWSEVGGTEPGAGAVAWTYTLTSGVDGTPIADADVWVSTDAAGTNVVASGRTDALGVVTFYLDAGTYYVWRQKTGWNFVNPDTEVVS